MEVLTTYAKEKGTYVVSAAFTDEDGSAETPKTLTWTLTDENGTVVNSRLDVAVSSPTSSEDIGLSGDDLSLDVGVGIYRVVLLEWTYDSDLGSDLVGKDLCKFPIEETEIKRWWRY